MIDMFRRLFGRGTPWSARAQVLSGAGDPPAATNSATEDDILACFRLLLGRPPNPEEWAGHSAQAGQPLPAVVASYLNSLEFARRDLLRPDDVPPQIAERSGYKLFASPSDALIGRHVLAGAYEPEIECIFRRLLRPGMAVIDIGANIGVFTMLSAALVGPEGHVLAIEPNPANARLLEASRRLNGFEHVTTAQVAAGRDTGLLVLNTSHSNGTTSTPADDPGQLLQAQTVPCIRVDLLAEGRRRIDLIKVDVEGAEYNALLGASSVIARDHPLIISEFSPDQMPGISGIDGPGYLRWFHARGYNLAVINPDGTLQPAAKDVDTVMRAYAARGTDHIDLLATTA